jgi:hypothetical protein
MDLHLGGFIPISCFSMEARSMGMLFSFGNSSMVFRLHNRGSYDELNWL